MKKTIIPILLGILLIGAFGAAAVSAAASDGAGINNGNSAGPMHRWAARNTDSGCCGGNFSNCPYFNASTTSEFKVKTIDDAYEIARKEIDSSVSKENINQVGRWWIISYKDKNGTSSQARINAVTGQVFTGYSPTGSQTCGLHAHGFGRCRANS
ncbi:MAG: hypothetical protein QG646_3645 [Euryarchaeota archaeon]|nr:hypothetical protein [Euryarchaeota archaeon]